MTMTAKTLSECSKKFQILFVFCSFMSALISYIQRTLVITTLFVTKDFAVKSNLLL